MRNLLIFLFIIQKKDNRNREIKLGKGGMFSYRFNPFNPLSYIVILLILIFGILAFGIIGFTKEIDLVNPFKWS